MNIMLAIAGVAFLTLVHEFGHWVLARLFGFRTPVFSIGFGPRWIGLVLGRFWQTEFRITPLLIGGFVRIPEMSGLGEAQSGAGTTGGAAIKIWKRVVVALGGVIANFVCAVLLMFGLILCGFGQAGASHPPVWQAACMAVNLTIDLTRQMFVEIATLAHLLPAPSGADNSVHGVVGVVQVGAAALRTSWANFSMLLALVSLNFATFNILPLPLLDGGHIVFLLVEKMRGKPVPAKWRMRISKAFLLLLFAVMILGLVNDIRHPMV